MRSVIIDKTRRRIQKYCGDDAKVMDKKKCFSGMTHKEKMGC